MRLTWRGETPKACKAFGIVLGTQEHLERPLFLGTQLGSNPVPSLRAWHPSPACGDLGPMPPGGPLSSLQALFSPQVPQASLPTLLTTFLGPQAPSSPLKAVDSQFQVQHHLYSQRLKNEEQKRHGPSGCADTKGSVCTPSVCWASGFLTHHEP